MTTPLHRWAPALVATASFLAAGCNIDHSKVEDSIRQGLKEKGVNLKSVDCPADRRIKKGDTFDCTGVDEGGQHLVFTVTQGDGGNVNWKLDGMIINQAKLGDSIEHKVGKAADVKCPEKTVILKPGQSFTCDVDVDGKTHKVLITLQDKEGNVAWKITS
jgi:hypothetical protein